MTELTPAVLNTLRGFLHAVPGESAEEAVARYDLFFRAAYDSGINIPESFHTTTGRAQGLEDAEGRLGMTCPAPLRRFLETCGVRHSDVGPTICPPQRWQGFFAAVEEIWGGREDLLQELGAQEVQRLNREFVLFGMRFIDDNVHVYYAFDRLGLCYRILFDQDSIGEEKYLGAARE